MVENSFLRFFLGLVERREGFFRCYFTWKNLERFVAVGTGVVMLGATLAGAMAGGC